MVWYVKDDNSILKSSHYQWRDILPLKELVTCKKADIFDSPLKIIILWVVSFLQNRDYIKTTHSQTIFSWTTVTLFLLLDFTIQNFYHNLPGVAADQLRLMNERVLPTL